MSKNCCDKGECKKEFCKKSARDGGNCSPKKGARTEKGHCPPKNGGHCGFGTTK
jgi:hypothetical protein